MNTKNTQIKGADLIVKCLEELGVDTLFAYPGGSTIELHNAFTHSKKIRVILPRHEQGGGFMAQGYTRASSKVGVCMVTSGPGAMNLLTSIADAYMDSIPMIAITGQVMQQFIGKSAFQETDVYGMTLPVVKHSYLVLDPNDLPKILKEAFTIATSGRPGPVLIDIPKDVQQKIIDMPSLPDSVYLPGLQKTPFASFKELETIYNLINEAKKPVLYVGGGIFSANAVEPMRAFVKKSGMPVVSTMMALGATDPLDEESLYWFGMHGTLAGNFAVEASDLLICAGARFDDRVTGALKKFAPNAKVVHIDIDRSEHNKNVPSFLPIHSDVKFVFEKLNEFSYDKENFAPWLKIIGDWKKSSNYPFSYKSRTNAIIDQDAITEIYNQTKGNAIITTGVGQHQMWTAQHYLFNRPRTFLSSLGAGTMGFGLPAALGAKIAMPNETVIDVDGDGSFTMNIQEMATAVQEKIPVKVALMNNQHLGMVMQWEDIFYDSVRANTILCDPENIGSARNLPAIYPNFIEIAKGFGWKARRVYKKEELKDAVKEMLEATEPFLLEVITEADEHVLPFIPPGGSAKDIITD